MKSLAHKHMVTARRRLYKEIRPHVPFLARRHIENEMLLARRHMAITRRRLYKTIR